MSRDVADFIGRIPQHYDRNLAPLIFVDYAADLARRVASCRPARVLETAAGTGVATRHLRDQLPARTHLTATDLNQPMLEIARTKFRTDEQVEFQQSDATALPFKEGSFDVVVCQFGVMFFPDKDKSYREVRRVLVPGGRYLFNVWDSHQHNPFGRIAHEVTGSFFPADPPQFQSIPFSYRLESIEKSLIDAGFIDISSAVVPLQKELPDPAMLARGLVYGSPLIDQVRARGGIEPEMIVDAIVREYRREFGSGRMPLRAIFVSATSPS